MRILALETSGMSGSAAALDDARPLATHWLAAGQRSAQALAPTIQALLAEVGWAASSLKLITVTQGPGSFTSLRIGVTTAKAFAYAVGADLVGVNTLEAIARQAPESAAEVQAVIDAQRQELFVARYARQANGKLVEQAATTVIANEVWLSQLQSGDVVTGPGLARLVDRLPPGVIACPAEVWTPSAATVGQLGYELFLTGRRDEVFQLVPQYFRRTAAEEQWERRPALG